MKKIIPVLIILFIAILVFSTALFTEKHIASYDATPVAIASLQQSLEGSQYNQGWLRTILVGNSIKPMPYNIYYFAAKIFEPAYALKFTYFLSILLAGIFFYLLMRSHGLNQISALFGAIAYMLTNTVITLILPGHHGKLQSLAWMPLLFLFLRKALLQDRFRCYIYAGFFLGLFFQGKAYQMSVYFAFLASFYFLYLLFRKKEQGTKFLQFIKTKYRSIILPHIAGFIGLIIVTLLLASILVPSVAGYTEARSSQHKQYTRTAEQKWDWATQWSIAPLEVTDFFLPGIFGLKSRDAKYPYWGDLGKSADNGKSLPNLKLHSEHIGMVVFLFLIFALFMRGRNKENEHRFWIAALLITLLLALGKYLHLPYYLFYQLPFMDKIRNPNKFAKIVSFAAVILATYGFHYLFFSKKEEKEQNKQKKFTLGLAAFSGLLILLSLISAIFLTDPFQDMVETKLSIMRLPNAIAGAENIAGQLPIIFLLGGLISGFVAFLFYYLQKPQKSKAIQIIAYITIAMAGLELWLSARHFINYEDKKQTSAKYKMDALVEQFINDKTSRVLFRERSQFGHIYGTFKFSYYNINTISFQKLALSQGRYSLFYMALRKDYPRLVRLLNINRVISMANITNGSMTELKKFALDRNKTRFLRIYKPNDALPRAYTVTNFKLYNSAQDVAKHLASTNFDPATTACLEKGSVTKKQLDQITAVTNWTSSSDLVQIEEYQNNKIILNSSTKGARILIFQDYYHKNWEVTINGKQKKVFPVNLLYRGVIIPKGKNRIEFAFKPDGLYYKISMFGFLLVFIVFLFDAVPFIRTKYDNYKNKSQKAVNSDEQNQSNSTEA